MANINRTTTVSQNAQCIQGIQKNLAGAATLPLTGSSFTPAALILLFQSQIDAATALTQAEAEVHAKVLALRALTRQVAKVRRALRQLVINTYGEQSPLLADFGFHPPATAALTPEQEVARAAKARATRAARGTKGPKAKLAVQGNVTGVVVTPVTEAPAAPAAAPAPAAPVAPAVKPA